MHDESHCFTLSSVKLSLENRERKKKKESRALMMIPWLTSVKWIGACHKFVLWCIMIYHEKSRWALCCQKHFIFLQEGFSERYATFAFQSQSWVFIFNVSVIWKSRICAHWWHFHSNDQKPIDHIQEIIRKCPQITDTDKYLRLGIVIFLSNFRVIIRLCCTRQKSRS